MNALFGEWIARSKRFTWLPILRVCQVCAAALRARSTCACAPARLASPAPPPRRPAAAERRIIHMIVFWNRRLALGSGGAGVSTWHTIRARVSEPSARPRTGLLPPRLALNSARMHARRIAPLPVDARAHGAQLDASRLDKELALFLKKQILDLRLPMVCLLSPTHPHSRMQFSLAAHPLEVELVLKGAIFAVRRARRPATLTAPRPPSCSATQPTARSCSSLNTSLSLCAVAQRLHRS